MIATVWDCESGRHVRSNRPRNVNLNLRFAVRVQTSSRGLREDITAILSFEQVPRVVNIAEQYTLLAAMATTELDDAVVFVASKRR